MSGRKDRKKTVTTGGGSVLRSFGPLVVGESWKYGGWTLKALQSAAKKNIQIRTKTQKLCVCQIFSGQKFRNLERTETKIGFFGIWPLITRGPISHGQVTVPLWVHILWIVAWGAVYTRVMVRTFSLATCPQCYTNRFLGTFSWISHCLPGSAWFCLRLWDLLNIQTDPMLRALDAVPLPRYQHINDYVLLPTPEHWGASQLSAFVVIRC